MTLEEKTLQIGISAPALNRLGIEEYQYWSETLHGIAGKPAQPTSPGMAYFCVTSVYALVLLFRSAVICYFSCFPDLAFHTIWVEKLCRPAFHQRLL